MRLIDSRKLAAHHAGSHRRVRAGDALAYVQRRQHRLAAVSEITEADGAVVLECLVEGSAFGRRHCSFISKALRAR